MTAARVRDFVTALFKGVEGYVNLRTLGPVEQIFVRPDDWEGLEAFVTARRDRDCYVGVAARLTPGDGSLANCGALPALFADLDSKDIGAADARRRLDSMALPPSVTVQSGGGFHAYWLLREPLDLQSESAIAKRLLRRLGTHLGADLAAAEPARILRLPNTRNFKYQPPRPVLRRIVVKVDELMALCDRLEAAQVERERRRDRVVVSSLNRLSHMSVDVPNLHEYARFHIDHLPRLFTHQRHIERLRVTIINLALRGQLVVQDPNDESGEHVIKCSRAEKERIVKKGVVKRSQSMPHRSGIDGTFPLSPGWVWGRIEDLFTSVTDGDHLPPPKTEGGVPFLVIGNVRTQQVNFSGCRHVSEDYYNALDDIRRPRKGDILYTLVGSYGIPVLVTENRPFCVQRHIAILRPSECIDRRFLVLALESQLVFDQATECATGIAQKTVPLAGLRRMLLPVPPLAEQHRIVAKVAELLTLCDQLEMKFTTVETESRRFLEAVLHEALTSVA